MDNYSDNYSSFFVTVLNLKKDERMMLFYTLCVLMRTLLGFVFFLNESELVLCYISAAWGLFWTFLIIKNKRWEDVRNLPPWYRGVTRFILRMSFIFLLVLFGTIGIFSNEHRSAVNKSTAVLIWIDLVKGVIDYTLYY
jgi:hypothetical protein